MNKILITIPNLKRPGGVSALYKILDYDISDGIIYFPIQSNNKGKFARLIELIKIYFRFCIKCFSVDIVHVNPSLNRNSFIRDGLFVLLARLLGKKTLIYWHGWDNEFQKQILKNRLLKLFFNKTFLLAEMHLVLGSNIMEELKEIGVKLGSIKLESNAASDFYLKGRNLFKQVDILSPIVILFIARLEPAKGVYIAIETCQILNNKNYNVKLIICGDGSEFKKVQKKLVQEEITNVEMLGHIENELKNSILLNADFLIFPSSHSEGMPITILEGMLYGLPIISSPVGGIPDWVSNKDNGFLINNYNAMNYADCIESLINNPYLYNKISKNNINKATDLFTPSAVKERLDSYYNALKYRIEINLSEIQKKNIKYIENNKHLSYDLYDALTNPFLDKISKGNNILRRILIQMNAKSPINLRWLGMQKKLHTKTISDLLWYYSILDPTKKQKDKVNIYFDCLIRIKSSKGYGWGLRFPYTSRFTDASAETPNLYNTITSGISICYSIQHLSDSNKQRAKKVLKGIIDFLDNELGFIDEDKGGWYLYYPNQKYPTYNVNALTLYFLVFIKKIGINLNENIESRIDKILYLLVHEQNSDGSWYYSRSPKGKWVDGFHSAFIIESIAFAYKNSYNNVEIKKSLDKGWSFYLDKMFTNDGFPRYFLKDKKYPIESQNIAQAIQTISIFNLWLGKEQDELLKNIIKNVINNLYDKKGFFYHKKTKRWIYKQPYFRWSITPMILALEYAKKALKTDKL